jgi:hypothetical protein
MTIVTTSPPKRQRARKRAQPVQLQQSIITAWKSGRWVSTEREIDPEAEARVRGVLRADDPAAVTINEGAAPPEVSAVTNPPGVVTLGEVASRLSVLEVSCNAVRAMGGCALIACWWSMALRSRCRRCARSSRRTASGCRRHRSMILAGCISAACPGWRKRDRFTDSARANFLAMMAHGARTVVAANRGGIR